MKYNPHNYQKDHIQDIIDIPFFGLYAQVGRGKSSMTLTAIEYLMSRYDITMPLIIGPKRVVSHTWKAELEKWDHTKYLTISRIIGDPKQRMAAIIKNADLYTVSRDNIAWLVDYWAKRKKWPYDMIVIDESSNFRNHRANRYKAVKKVLPFTKRLLELTGTPFTKSLEGVWGQVYLLDQGKRLGRTLSGFRDQYMTQNYNGFGYVEKSGSIEIVSDKIKDICASIKNSDFDDVPERIDLTDSIELDTMTEYLEFERSTILNLPDIEISPVNSGALYNKLLQYSNGAVYDASGQYHVVDNTKLETLVEDIEALDGQPVFIAYMFKSDFERMKQVIPGIVKLETDEQIDAFNRGEIPILASHPASNAYGLNLQESCYNMIWFGVPWDLELYQQFLGRVHRQGQKNRVINKHLIGKGTVEELVISRLGHKDFNQNLLLDALKMRFINSFKNIC